MLSLASFRERYASSGPFMWSIGALLPVDTAISVESWVSLPRVIGLLAQCQESSTTGVADLLERQ